MAGRADKSSSTVVEGCPLAGPAGSLPWTWETFVKVVQLEPENDVVWV